MDMSDRFFDGPILNSPYNIPAKHWELDETGQPTNCVLDRRRQVSFIAPIPRPKKRKGAQQAHSVLLICIVIYIGRPFLSRSRQAALGTGTKPRSGTICRKGGRAEQAGRATCTHRRPRDA